MLSLTQKLSQSQKLSPQQIQYQKLLQLNTLALEQRIKTELELNPVLEEVMEEEISLEELQKEKETETDSDSDEEYESSEDEFDIEDYMNQDDIESNRINYSADEDDTQPVAPDRLTLTDHLIEQLHLLDLADEEMIVGEVIIQNLQSDGYLKADLAKIVSELINFEHIDVTFEEAEKILKEIQLFDPLGVAARDLRECLLIQLRNSSYDPYYSFLAEKILEDHYKHFVNKKFDLIQKELNLTRETLKSTLEIIYRLDPKPGEGTIDITETNQISPDFLIEKVEENFIITLNDRSMPSVTVSQTYLEMINTNKRKRKISKRDKEAHKFLREKFESAKWFIFSIQQRRETLLKIMRAILEKQFEFFENGPRFLRPMIYKDIAEIINMDISTISRVVNGKYVQSPQGIHELKYFFSEGLSTDSGEDISNKHIKELIKEICEKESKKSPFSDDKIAKILVEKGIHIARRTVAKYREQLNIPVARLRKEL
ncbi:MAG: RNA polymerase factor sigma-54 [Melioribacteraceae bacterium]|nr:RNA polymerase factor sigma-54 [Melioribacteraceae bacterium]MCF8263236.1 RNA polymerase factor sigma-54 [Melioribacteraceae bacterium]MCF8412210.1 RNA polymerase factor sigma-54 [Melioribacteraceae bacterium]MCF8431024.1 RNA polymerase factor sigma-54 [Melioribacteraceae bacterium]